MRKNVYSFGGGRPAPYRSKAKCSNVTTTIDMLKNSETICVGDVAIAMGDSYTKPQEVIDLEDSILRRMSDAEEYKHHNKDRRASFRLLLKELKKTIKSNDKVEYPDECIRVINKVLKVREYTDGFMKTWARNSDKIHAVRVYGRSIGMRLTYTRSEADLKALEFSRK
jgi:ribosomal protein S20